ncbi:DUF1848 family protein [bacterium]|nr:DUF1848 family protein [bacterium]
MNQVISASRRTDLPQAFPEILASWLAQEWVKVKNPYNQQERTIDLAPDNVHTLVLWSKDYSRLIENQADLQTLVKRYAQLYIHFSVTGFGGTKLEPGVVDYKKAVSQFEKLVQIVGSPLRVNWRFDPIVFWKDEKQFHSNLHALEDIAAVVSSFGIKNMTFSICHWYQKSKQRAKAYDIQWVDIKKTRLKTVAEIVLEKSSKYGIKAGACCTNEVIPYGIPAAKCIDGELLTLLHPDKKSAQLGKDKGQRTNCGCTPSIDIGSYDLVCNHGCAYCYANPKYS